MCYTYGLDANSAAIDRNKRVYKVCYLSKVVYIIAMNIFAITIVSLSALQTDLRIVAHGHFWLGLIDNLQYVLRMDDLNKVM